MRPETLRLETPRPENARVLKRRGPETLRPDCGPETLA
jgi:hypothetical protein